VRRHQVGDRTSRVFAAIVAATVVAGCAAAGPTTVPTASAADAVTITSAPGDTLAFEPDEATVRADGPITLTFRNGSSLPHNMVFTAGLTASTRTIVRPGTSDELLLVPPAPGAYPFVCTIHDGMAGTLIVQPTTAGG
jgi:plastocyanin